ncbi:MAG: DEAD/DEAH box helicase [Saprospiraceae bacterium]|nr:DEAD/DEAH box helicase [Saprospiraceae bacterium]
MKTDVSAFLTKLGMEKLTPMQEQAFEPVYAKRHVLLTAPTGSGKTLAYLLPLLMRMNKSGGKLMIVVPTRELAIQISNVVRELAMGFHVVLCYGGHHRRNEMDALSRLPGIVIGTPGRLADHIRNRAIDPSYETLVLDEYDKSLEIGYKEELDEITGAWNKPAQILLTSATRELKMPDTLAGIDWLDLEFKPEKSKSKLLVRLVPSSEKDKLPLLAKILHHTGQESVIVFANHKVSVDRIGAYLKLRGLTAGIFHGGLDQVERELVLTKFRNGSIHILVSTDLAARGLDIPQARYVIHYHMPSKEDEYVHRNGRTARMGAGGTVYILHHESENIPDYLNPIPETWYTPEEEKDIAVQNWCSLQFNKGRNDKISKGDVAGFLMKTLGLSADDIGLIELKDNKSIVAIKREKSESMDWSQKFKLKGTTVRIEVV